MIRVRPSFIQLRMLRHSSYYQDIKICSTCQLGPRSVVDYLQVPGLHAERSSCTADAEDTEISALWSLLCALCGSVMRYG
jgi:hypothetical protein